MVLVKELYCLLSVGNDTSPFIWLFDCYMHFLMSKYVWLVVRGVLLLKLALSRRVEAACTL